MLRLVIAIGIAMMLMPNDENKLAENETTIEVSALETLGAAKTVFDDVLQFCERNEEACLTGQTIFTKLGQKARSGFQQFAESRNPEQGSGTDQIKTSSVK